MIQSWTCSLKVLQFNMKKKKKKSSLYLRSEEEKITTLKSWTDILL